MNRTSKQYQDFIMEYTLNEIQEQFNFKTKKEAKEYFFKALAHNVVQAEISSMIMVLIENQKKEACT